MANLKKVFLGAMLTGGLVVGAPSCSSKDKNDKDNDKQKTEVEAKKQNDTVFADFKACMAPITPQAMIETILTEGVELDNKGLCKPYRKKLNNGKWDKWTIGFGITQLDGKPVTKNTRHITLKEAWEKSIKFYEDDEAFFFMWCYEIGMDNLNIDTKEKALCLASVLYNSNSNCIENPNDTQNHCNRNAKLRELYEKYGDAVTAEQVKALFAEYPISQPTSFGKVLNGGSETEWANALGGFCAEGGGIYWRRWLQGQIALGNITYKDLLDLPMKSMYDFWCVIGKQKSALFNTNKDGSITVNPSALKKFKEWSKNPVDKKGNKITRKTVREIMNSIDPALVARAENATFTPSSKSKTVYFADVSARALNDSSYIAYKNGDYTKALKAGQSALKLATDSLQLRAANYNIGISYSATGKYNKAVRYLKQSLAYEETKLAQKALQEAQQKRDERSKNRRKTAGKIALGFGLGFAGAVIARKKFLAQRQKHK